MCNYLVTGCGGSSSNSSSNVNLPPYKDPQGEYWDLPMIVDNIPMETGYEGFELYEGTRGTPIRHFFRTLKAGDGIVLTYDSQAGLNNNSIVISTDLDQISEGLFGPGGYNPITSLHELDDVFRSGFEPPFAEGALLFYKLDAGNPNFNESWEVTSSSPLNFQIPSYDAIGKQWVFITPNIDSLQDVDTQGKADNTVLVWNEGQGVYEHLPYGGGGGTNLPDGGPLLPHLGWDTLTSSWQPVKISIFDLDDIDAGAIADDYILVYKSIPNRFEYEPKPVATIYTASLPDLNGGGSGKVLVDDGNGGLGLDDNSDVVIGGLEKYYDDNGPYGPGDMMIPKVDDSGFGLVNLDDEITNNTTVQGLSTSSHDALALGGAANDTTDDTLNLVGQVLTVNLATPTTDGAMSAADKSKLDGVASGANNYVHPNHTGDVTSTGDGVTAISSGAVSNSKLANMPSLTIKGNDGLASAEPKDLTVSEVKAMLDLTTEFSYFFPQGATYIEDLTASDIEIQTIIKTVGVNTVQISVNGGPYFNILTGLPYTLNSGDSFVTQITYNPLYNTGVVTFKGVRL